MQARPATPDGPVSARPEMTRAIMRDTGLSDAQLTTLVDAFYARVRRDPLLGPIFEAEIHDWPAHLARMVDFWSSIALMTGRYHGAAIAAHAGLALTRAHFDRWLTLFGETAEGICTPEGAALLINRAARIARAMHSALGDAPGDPSPDKRTT